MRFDELGGLLRRLAFPAIFPHRRASMDRTAELAAIEHFLQGRGAQRCPPRFASAVAGALPRELETARIAAVRVSETVPLRLLIDALYRRCGPTKP